MTKRILILLFMTAMTIVGCSKADDSLDLDITDANLGTKSLTSVKEALSDENAQRAYYIRIREYDDIDNKPFVIHPNIAGLNFTDNPFGPNELELENSYKFGYEYVINKAATNIPLNEFYLTQPTNLNFSWVVKDALGQIVHTSNKSKFEFNSDGSKNYYVKLTTTSNGTLPNTNVYEFGYNIKGLTNNGATPKYYDFELARENDPDFSQPFGMFFDPNGNEPGGGNFKILSTSNTTASCYECGGGTGVTLAFMP